MSGGRHSARASQTCWYTSMVARTARSTERKAARSLPLRTHSARSWPDVSSVALASALAVLYIGTTSMAAPAATSGSDVRFEQTTGTEEANASRMGMPKPS